MFPDTEYSEFELNIIRKARKVHTCTECRLDIFPGAHYLRTTGKFDDYLYTSKTCDRCCKLYTELTGKINNVEFKYGDLHEYIDSLDKELFAKLNIIEASFCRVADNDDSYYEDREIPIYSIYYPAPIVSLLLTRWKP